MTEEDKAASSRRAGGKMMSGGMRLALSGGAQAIVQLVVLATLGRLLTPSDFGIVAAGALISDIAVNLSQLGLGPALVQRRDIDDTHIRTALTFSLLMGLTVTALLFLAAPWTAALLRAPESVHVMRWLSLSFFLSSIGVVANSIAMRELSFGLLARRRFFAYLFGYGVCGIAAAAAGLGVWALVIAQLAQTALASLLVIAGVRHSWAMRFHGPAFRELAAFGAGLSLDKIGSAIAVRIDQFIISRNFDARALGLYTRSYNLMRFPAMMLGSIIDDVAFPGFSSMQGNLPAIRGGFLRGLAILNLVLIPTAAALAVLAHEVVWVLLGPQWTGAAPILSILALSLPFRSTQRLSAATARAVGAPWAAAFCQYVYIGMVALGAGLGSHWGMTGLATGVGIAIFGQFAALTIVVMRRAGVPASAVLRVHFAALPLALLAASLLLATKEALLLADLHILPLLLVTCLVSGAIMAVLIVALPRLLLGIDGCWLMIRLMGAAPARLRNLGAIRRLRSRFEAVIGRDQAAES